MPLIIFLVKRDIFNISNNSVKINSYHYQILKIKNFNKSEIYIFSQGRHYSYDPDNKYR